jgi:hypothetical protein
MFGEPRRKGPASRKKEVRSEIHSLSKMGFTASGVLFCNCVIFIISRFVLVYCCLPCACTPTTDIVLSVYVIKVRLILQMAIMTACFTLLSDK